MTTSRTPRWTACSAAIFYCGVFAIVASARAAGGYIAVTDAGSPSSTTCTLAQAIARANAANGIVAASVGSATTNNGTCSGAISGLNEIDLTTLSAATITLNTVDNYWYGRNALPPIASSILLVGGSKTILAQHVGDPTPTTANAFRLFYVSGGLELPAGSLTLENVVLKGGYAKGGDSTFGGGGAGMGGAIFNQGALTLRNVSLIGNVAQGGIINSGMLSGAYGGGGMGEDSSFGSAAGGGFGGGLGGTYGGSSGIGSSTGSGGGGGGFVNASSGAAGGGAGGAGGGNGALGGTGGSSGASPPNGGGDGGAGGDYSGTLFGIGAAGGSFGSGSLIGSSFSAGGGGGVGGGGSAGSAGSDPQNGLSTYSTGGGGGGFGGGGGSAGIAGGVVGVFITAGGFGGFGGGGGGATDQGGGGGFGGGSDLDGGSQGGGGAGMGGAIFNHTGSVTMLNVTATGNAARGGAGTLGSGNGSGLGSVLFNLNGTATIDFSTLAGNALSGNNGQADSLGPEDGTVYSLAYGNKIQDGTASSASLTIHNSIVHGTHADGGSKNDLSVNVVNGANTNMSSVVFAGKNFIGQSYTVVGITPSGTSPSTADPLLGSLSLYFGTPGTNTNPTPVLPIGSNSLAYNAAPSCLEADGSTTLTGDERYQSRPQFSQCDVGAYEFDGDYIFADGADVKL